MALTGFDVARARQDTTGCESVIHFNNAGAALMPRPVVDHTVEHLQLEANIGGYEAAERRQAAIMRVYTAAASLFHCHADEIACVENATRGWHSVFQSIPLAGGDRVLIDVVQYGSNYISLLHAARRTGIVIDVIPSDDTGALSVKALESMIDKRVKAIAITHVPSNNALVNPVNAVGSVARSAGVLYLLDACQSAGQMPVDVADIGCDVLVASGRKYLRGPRGTGLLYVRRGVTERLEPPFLDIHSAQLTALDSVTIRADARRFETWEANCASRIGLGVAIDYAAQWGLIAIRERVSSLAARLRARLQEIPGITGHDMGSVQCGIVTFTSDRTDPVTIRQALAARGINVSVSGPHSSPIDMQARSLASVVRASVHYYNTEQEVDELCSVLSGIV